MHFQFCESENAVVEYVEIAVFCHIPKNSTFSYVKQVFHLDIFFNQRYSKKHNGRLAQLVRASGLHPECREFDPLTVQADLKRGPFLF